jgi:hypothetical protein
MICIIIFNLRTAAFKAYCVIWIISSNFRYLSVSTRVTTREHPAAEGGTVDAKFARILPNMPT